MDVEVVGEFMINSDVKDVRKLPPNTPNPADSGLGTEAIASPLKEISGLDEQKNNFPAVYLKFYKKGTDELLGTYLATQLLR